MKKFFLVIVVFVFGCVQQNTESTDKLKGKVIGITDGDTFKLLVEGNEQLKIRLYGIDCPERKQDFGQVAKQKLGDLIYGQYVSIVRKDKDRYGRTIAIVFKQSGVCINEEMLKAG